VKFFSRTGKRSKQAVTGIHYNAETARLISRFGIISLFIIALLLFSSYLVWIFEQGGTNDNSIKTFWDSIWWAIVTIATVGYGDKVPVTGSGRFVGVILIVVGFTLITVFTGLIASLFVEDRLKGAKGLKLIKSHDHVVLCGWNKTAESILKAMVEKGLTSIPVCMITNQPPEFFESIASQFSSLQIKYVRGESTQEETLKRASIGSAAQVIILADQNLDLRSADDRTIIVANAVHYMASKAKITVQLINSENRNLLQRIGIQNIIVYDEIGGYIIANNLFEDKSLCIYTQLAKSAETSISTCEIDSSFIGKSYGELFDFFHKDKKILLIGLMSKEADLNIDAIFDDNASAIDQFIKSTLNASQKMHLEEKNNIRWNPGRETVIQDDDHAILLA